MRERNEIDIILLFFFVLCFWSTSKAQGDSIPFPIEYHIQTYHSVQPLPTVNWIIEEGYEALSPEDLLAGTIKDAQIIGINKNPHYKLKDRQNYWLHYRFISQIQLKNWILFFRYDKHDSYAATTFTFINTWFTKDNHKVDTGRSGFAVPLSKRDKTNVFDKSIIDFNINKGDTLDVWVQFSGWETPVPLPHISICHTVEGIPESLRFNKVHFGMVYGFLLGYISLGLFLYIWIGDKVYFWFLFLLIIRLIFELNLSKGLLIQYVYPEYSFLNPYIMSVLLAGFFVALLQFGRVYINTPVHFPKIDVGLRLYMVICLVMIILGGIDYDRVTFTFPIFFFLFIPFISMFIYFLFSDNKLARFFSVGLILMAFSWVTIAILTELNIVKAGIDVNPFIQFGLMVVLTLALAYRFQLLNTEKNKAQEERNLQLERINVASSKFVPKTFLNFLGKENILEASLGDYIEKQVSVLFSDIREYTALSEQMTPKENFHFVKAFNQRMGPIIQRHNGFVNQYLGDGLMAIFPENIENTLKAAIAMQQTLQEYNRKRTSINKVPIRIGIGIHAGPLIMGIIGDEQRMDATTISDTVNVASRVEGLTKYFGTSILISETVLGKLPNSKIFNWRYLGLVQLKGRKEVMKIYECFDGDEPEFLALKKVTLNDFKKGMKHYYNKSFENSLESFEKVLDINPNDSTAKLFIKKCKVLMKNGVDINWNGVEMMTFK